MTEFTRLTFTRRCGMTDDRTAKRCRNAARWSKDGVFLCNYHKARVRDGELTVESRP